MTASCLPDFWIRAATASPGCNAIRRRSNSFPTNSPQAILMDVHQNEVACLELCYSIKTASAMKGTRVLILSRSGDARQEIAAFEAGADDFVRFPLDPEALHKRLQARLSDNLPNQALHSTLHGTAKLQIDREAFAVYLNQENIAVSRKEFELLHLMASQPGKVFTREEIFEKVWKRKPTPNDRTIDVHILRLRRKLGQDFITTQKGVGYRFIAS